MSDRVDASKYNGGGYMPGYQVNINNFHINGGPRDIIGNNYNYEYYVVPVAGTRINVDFDYNSGDYTVGENVEIGAGESMSWFGVVVEADPVDWVLKIDITGSYTGDTIFRPADYDNYQIYGYSNHKVSSFSSSNVEVLPDYVYEFKIAGSSGLQDSYDIEEGIGVCVSLDAHFYYGYIYEISGNGIYIKMYGNEPLEFDLYGLNGIDYIRCGGHWDGSEIHHTIYPDYSQILIEGHIKPYPQESNGSVNGMADHLLYMAVDANGEYSPFGSIIDNENMYTSNLFHTSTNDTGFGQPCFRGLVFKATTYQKYWYPFQFRDNQDIQYYECEFDLGEYQRAAVCVDDRADDKEWEGKISFHRCVLNGGQNLVRWDGTGNQVLLPRGEYSVNDCVIKNTTSNALSWVTECHNNFIYNCRGHGIITARHCHSNISVTNNTIVNCDQGIWTFPVDSPATGQVGPVVISRNIVCNVLGRGIGVGRGYGPVILEDNIVWEYNGLGEDYKAYGGLNTDDPMGDTTEPSHQSYPVNLVLEKNNQVIDPELGPDNRPFAGGVCDLGNGEFIGCFASVGESNDLYAGNNNCLYPN